ncbi:hypothetical protein [Xanthocytophaga agilis]|uniref:Uncharacterized protein n=1 Tax=Xanthocytophaga agilis TaxID=3048010 RepID=A0AAE3R9J4_9BACT|nr:hypothetical protein [Xanthocytophaga agilis]MDJ1506136.1 hypothetical protein [Xanthocytophaga agilis]
MSKAFFRRKAVGCDYLQEGRGDVFTGGWREFVSAFPYVDSIEIFASQMYLLLTRSSTYE